MTQKDGRDATITLCVYGEDSELMKLNFISIFQIQS